MIAVAECCTQFASRSKVSSFDMVALTSISCSWLSKCADMISGGASP